MRRVVIRVWSGIAICLLCVPLHAQFYNGHQMTFGKNRVQYNSFFWNFYRFDRYDVYFNQFGEELARYTDQYASVQLRKIESSFDYTLDKRLIFIVYNKLTDFRQGNIGLVTGNDEYNTGGVTRIINNKVFIYYDGNHQHLEEQVNGAIAEVILNEMLYGSNIRENVTNSTLISLPEWYRSGLISYVSKDWSVEMDNIVKDGILSGRYDKFNRLEGQDAIYAGHSFWKFIADRYGKSVIPNIVYLTRINKSVNLGFMNVLGFSLRELSNEWVDYYTEKYSKNEGNRTKLPDGKVLRHPRKKTLYTQVKVNPAADYLAWVTNQEGRYKIWICNTETGKRKCILRKEHRLEQIPDYTFPVLAWNPTGRMLAFFTEEKGGIKLYLYNLATKEMDVKNFLYFEKILDFSYSEDGLKLVLSAIQHGESDIYVHTLSSATNEQITNDIADDFNPRFIDGSKKILFSSNRSNDTLSVTQNCDHCTKPTFDLYIADYPSTGNVLTNLSEKPFTSSDQSLGKGENEFVFRSDRSGIDNRYIGRFDSTVSFVDTVTHYRFFSRSFPVTNYSRNIEEQDFSPHTGKVAEILYRDGRYNIFSHEIESDMSSGQNLVNTEYRTQLSSELREQDSLSKIRKEYISLDQLRHTPLVGEKIDSSLLNTDKVDINNYVFEEEKVNFLNNLLAKDNIVILRDTVKKEGLKPKIRIYETSFYTNYIVSQVDFNFLNSSYQAYNGGSVYYNPGFNMLFKLGTNDLFEDYKITGGVRFATDFDSNEYLLSFEDLKKRLDKQIVFHRQVFKTYDSDLDYYIKTQTHEVLYIVRYPFNQVLAVRGTASFRNDRTIYLSTDLTSLDKSDQEKVWTGLKGELIFDDTRSLGVNLYSGTRYKLFAEYYKQVNALKSDLWVLGADFRHYQRIHRNLIWAVRFAASTSFGHDRLIYYLGSVDNWINLSSKVKTFDTSVPVDDKVHYAYQTLATDMRGFTQNIRNGCNFALINNEIRFPIFRYILNRPISSSFLNNFQIVGFTDIGSAWTGLTPYSHKNAYDTQVLDKGTYKVIIDSNRDPIVAGYGFGLRTLLLGYFVRLDWAWGIENKVILPRIFYLSLNLDF